MTLTFITSGEYPSAPYDELIRAAGVEGQPPCPEPARHPSDLCRPLHRLNISKRTGGGKACGGLPRSDDAGKYLGGYCLKILSPIF